MSSTPERRDSSSSVASLQSVKNLVFGSSRRYSRAYDQPIVQSTLKGPKVRVEMEDGTTIDPLANSRSGMVLNPEAAAFGSLVAKVCVGVLSAFALGVSLVNKTTLMAASQFFGFMFMFVVTFAVSVGLYLWWSTSNRETVPLTIKSLLYLYMSSILSSLVSQVLSSYAAIPIASSLPQEASYFVFLSTMLFISVSLLVHRDSLNGMFSQEACIFVGLSLVLDFIAMCLFGDILPALIYTKLAPCSMLMGASLSLAGNIFPNLSPSAMYRVLRQSQGVQQQQRPASSVGYLGRPKRASEMSMDSSLFPRTSVSSASSYPFSNQTSNESELITEAHGVISDLLLTKESLNKDVQTKLKRVVELLNPKLERMKTKKVYVGDHIGYDRHDYEYDIHTPAKSDMSSGQNSSNRLSVVGRVPVKKRSSSSAYQHQTFSVATYASGMPVLDSEPVDRKRSIALREVRARISVAEKKHSVHKMGRERLGSLDRITKSPRTSSPAHSPFSHSPLSRSYSSSTEIKSDGELSTDGVGDLLSAPSPRTSLEGRQPVASPPESPSWSVGGAKVGCSSDGGSTLDIISEEGFSRPRSQTAPIIVFPSPLSGQMETTEEETDTLQSPLWAGRGGRPTSGYTVFSKFVQPTVYDISEYSNSHLAVFEQVGAWDFPIFELEEKTGGRVLSQMAYVLFQESGLMETFKIPQREFINFFRVLEANYGSNVYHNKTHAADVLHGVSYLMFEMIPGFSHAFSGGTEREWKAPSHGKGLGGNIASAFSILEVFAAYMAAAMHDFDHPGRTNAFLVATRSPLAILYNDRSVLENHHAAASWDLLTCVPAHNFLDALDEAELKRFRFLVVEAILATDLKMHFEILANFKAKTHPEDGEGIDWMSEMDRLMVMKIIIKMADINTPTKSFDLHRSWTERITEEFYQQSEEEMNLGLPPTIFMDRNHPEKLPAIQLSFIQHLVSPLFQGAAAAGIMPGILETTVLNKVDEDLEDSELAIEQKEEGLDLGDDAFTMQEDDSPHQKFMSILLTNLDINYDGWRAELPSEEGENEGNKEEQEKAKDADSAVNEDDDVAIPAAVSSEDSVTNSNQ